MQYLYNDNLGFKGVLGYNKAYGASSNNNQRSDDTSYSNFDWIGNENLNGNGLKVKEAYFLYFNDTFFDLKMPWTFSLGRRPSTNGFLANNREGFEQAKSPLGHAVNAEFDGLSVGWLLEDVIGVSGMHFKICAGRGLSNAVARYNMAAPDYVTDSTQSDDINLIGFIYTPYNDSQYIFKTMFHYAENLIGLESSGGSDLKDFGDLSGLTASFQVNGIGDMINDFLDEVILFASVSYSKTYPASGMPMLGDTESKTGNSYWVGAVIPGFIKEGESFGLEFNYGSRYWRSFTYAEDTVIGSKLAARGKAYEAYYNYPLIDDVFTFQLRYTYITYDYTGSNGFFGDASGTPIKMADAKANPSSVLGNFAVQDARAIRATFRYDF
jgi:hypothetical protein